MNPAEFQALLADVEVRLDRVRSLYEQYFQGVERLEPTIPRKEIDRKLAQLRRGQPRNTALRFRLQSLIQRYTTYQTYWKRVSRQIEEGTFRRDVLKARKRREDARVARKRSREAEREAEEAKPKTYEIEVDLALDDLQAEAEPLPVPPPEQKKPAPPVPSTAASESRQPAPSAPRAAYVPPAPPTKKRPVTPPGPPPPPRAVGKPSPPPPPASARTRKAPAGPPSPRPPPPKGLPKPPSRVAPPKASPKAPNGRAPAPARGPDGSRVEHIYQSYIAARRQNNERTDNVRLETVAKSIEKMLPKLEKKHRGKKIDFEVVIKNGKVGLKPIAR